MRRSAVLMLASAVATAAALAATVTPASAHICPKPVQIRVGEASTIEVGVTVEEAAVPDVEIAVPVGLGLDRVDPKSGWTFTRTGSSVRYHGGPIAPFACEYFSLGVTAPARGVFGIAVVQRSASGKVVARTTPDPKSSSDRVLDQFVYAGVTPPSSSGGSSGLSATTIAGIALVGVGILVAGALGFRSRRARGTDDHDGDAGSDRDTQLRARLEQFKKRKPDPPAPPAQ